MCIGVQRNASGAHPAETQKGASNAFLAFKMSQTHPLIFKKHRREVTIVLTTVAVHEPYPPPLFERLRHAAYCI